MISMQPRKTRDYFLAYIIAARNGGGVLSPGFQRQPRVVPHVSKGEEEEFHKLKQDFRFKASMLDISGVSQETRVVPVRDPLKQNAVLLREGFSIEEKRWVLCVCPSVEIFQSEADRSFLNRCKSPREGFDHLEKWYHR